MKDVKVIHFGDSTGNFLTGEVQHHEPAAAKIAQLEAEVERLRAALQRIADFYNGDYGSENEQAKMARDALGHR